MGWIPTIELSGRSLAEHRHVPHPAGSAGREIELSSWMMVLGTIRLVCALADYANTYMEALRGEPMSWRRLAWFFYENHPIVVLGAAWPLVLGWLLHRTRWPELLKAGVVTFLILSIGGVLAATADWNQTQEKSIALGSFRIARDVLWRASLSDILLGLLGTTQLVMELVTAIRALQLALLGHAAAVALTGPGPAVGGPDEKHAAARRARFGRLALYASAAYLVLMIRLPVWTTYLEILNQSRFVREFILQNDLQRIRSYRRQVVSTVEGQRIHELQVGLSHATGAWGEGQFLEARDHYLRLVALIDAMPPVLLQAHGRRTAALGLNNLAWLLATCPEAPLREPGAAVGYARRAVEFEPAEANSWNTLGVAYYRTGNWEEARSALYRSMELRDEGDSFDWFFLAMIHHRLGNLRRAQEWYDKAASWFRQYRPDDGELYRFQVEAAALLGLPRPAPPPVPPRVTPPGLPVMDPAMIRRRGHARIIDPADLRPLRDQFRGP